MNFTSTIEVLIINGNYLAFPFTFTFATAFGLLTISNYYVMFMFTFTSTLNFYFHFYVYLNFNRLGRRGSIHGGDADCEGRSGYGTHISKIHLASQPKNVEEISDMLLRETSKRKA